MNAEKSALSSPRLALIVLALVAMSALAGCRQGPTGQPGAQDALPPAVLQNVEQQPPPAPAPSFEELGPGYFKQTITQEEVMGHVRALAVDIGARPLGSEAEAQAAEYVAAVLRGWGYQVEVDEFQTMPAYDGWYGEIATPSATGGESVTSRNVIATKPGDGEILVVGAHVDSVAVGAGAGDNASGVAALLATAHALAGVDTTHTLVFAVFGAEENGQPSGAERYVEDLGPGTEDLLAMINVDSVGVGTDLYAYAGATVTWSAEGPPQLDRGPTWVRDLALELAAELDIALSTSPAGTWDGYTGDWSDHYAFVQAGVPIAYLEAWLWEVDSENPWWGQETPDGDVLHTAGDVYEAVVPQKVEQAAEIVAATAAVIATGLATAP